MVKRRYVVRGTDGVRGVAHKAGRGWKAATGTVLMAATVAAMTAFGAAPASASTRVSAVHQDLARAVQLGQVTKEQAARFEAKLSREILRD